MFLKSVLIGFLSFSILHAETLKECKIEADKISGCVVKEYDENGQLQSETPFKNDKQEGIEKAYYINGNLMAETPYKDNKINGIAKWYYENGNLVIEVSYKNDELHGDLKYYTKDGKLLALVKAENGRITSGKCFNNKVLTDKELRNLKDFEIAYLFDDVINYLQEICLKSDSK